MADKDNLLGELNDSSGGSLGGTDKLENKDVQAKLQKYWGQVADTNPNESVDRMKTRNAARRFAKGLPVRGEKEKHPVSILPKEELKLNEGHAVFGVGGECEEGGCKAEAGFLCFKRRIVVCKAHLGGHLQDGCGERSSSKAPQPLSKPPQRLMKVPKGGSKRSKRTIQRILD